MQANMAIIIHNFTLKSMIIIYHQCKNW